MGSKRVTVYINGTKDGMVMAVGPGTALDAFLREAGEKLGVPAKKLYMEGGGVIEDLSMVRDNDTLYVSQGEAYGVAAAGKRLAVGNEWSGPQSLSWSRRRMWSLS